MPSEKDALNEFIIQAFARGLSREAVISAVSERFDMGTRQAEGIVLRAETAFEREIEIRSSPAYLFWSALLLLVGLVMAGVGLWKALQPVIVALSAGSTLQTAVETSSDPILYNIPLFVLGIALAIGGFRGVKNTFWILGRKK